MRIQARILVPGPKCRSGSVKLPLLWSDIGLSFWGGVDASTGEVIDQQHPLQGHLLAGKVLAIPSGRGSCTGSSVLLQLILSGCAPSAILLRDSDDILSLGAIIAEELFGLQPPPIYCLGAEGFVALQGAQSCQIAESSTLASDVVHDTLVGSVNLVISRSFANAELRLSSLDREMLDGAHGKGTQIAMRVVARMAQLQGAADLIDITQAHIDGCVYTGPASLAVAQKLVEWGGHVRVPTTLNCVSVDRRRWQALGIRADWAANANDLADAYVALGASQTYTCAPYLLDTAPTFGEQITWAESNAVVYVNSVVGCRTQKYADFLDICIALVGRAPNAGCHLDSGRRPGIALLLPEIPSGLVDDSFYPTLGYLAGLRSPSRIPLIRGLDRHGLSPSKDDLKAMCAAFGTTSSAPMIHVEGITPEAKIFEEMWRTNEEETRVVELTRQGFEEAWNALDKSSNQSVELVALGNPHLSLAEVSKLAELCRGKRRAPQTSFVLTMGRSVYEAALQARHIKTLEDFGATIINDTCWCMLTEPVIPKNSRTLVTNSAKYAHYAPGLVSRQVRFRNMTGCLSAACTGKVEPYQPGWLTKPSGVLHQTGAQKRWFSSVRCFTLRCILRR